MPSLRLLDSMLESLEYDVTAQQEGLLPESLAGWYRRIVRDARELAPPWLEGKINVRQDPVLPMRFDLEISQRAVRFFIIATESKMDLMPRSTALYFLHVQDMLASGMDESLV